VTAGMRPRDAKLGGYAVSGWGCQGNLIACGRGIRSVRCAKFASLDRCRSVRNFRKCTDPLLYPQAIHVREWQHVREGIPPRLDESRPPPPAKTKYGFEARPPRLVLQALDASHGAGPASCPHMDVRGSRGASGLSASRLSWTQAPLVILCFPSVRDRA